MSPRFITALGMFSTLPVPPSMDVERSNSRGIIVALPVVGVVLGLLSGAATGLVVFCGAGALLAAAVGLAVLAGTTGALHLDGLADTADGLGSRKPPEQALVIMRQSDIGPMGVAALVFVLVLDLAALSSPAQSAAGRPGWVLVAALATGPVVARVPVVMATRCGLHGARTGGFGALFAGVTTRADSLLAMLVGLAVVALGAGVWQPFSWRIGLAWIASALASWLIAVLWRGHLVRRLGGLTGDCFGSIIEVTQTSYWVVLALALGLCVR